MKPSYIIFDFSGTLVRMRPAESLVKRTLLLKLSKKYKLAIITGARRAETLNIIKKLRLDTIFQTIVTANDTPYRKPDPKLFFTLPKAYIGDSIRDLQMAKSANVTFFRVSNRQSVNQIIKSLLK